MRRGIHDMLSFTNIIIFNDYYDFNVEACEALHSVLTLYPNMTQETSFDFSGGFSSCIKRNAK